MPSPCSSERHTRTHAHSHTYTNTHTHTHARTHTRNTRTHTHTHAHTHTHTHTRCCRRFSSLKSLYSLAETLALLLGGGLPWAWVQAGALLARLPPPLARGLGLQPGSSRAWEEMVQSAVFSLLLACEWPGPALLLLTVGLAGCTDPVGGECAQPSLRLTLQMRAWPRRSHGPCGLRLWSRQSMGSTSRRSACL